MNIPPVSSKREGYDGIDLWEKLISAHFKSLNA